MWANAVQKAWRALVHSAGVADAVYGKVKWIFIFVLVFGLALVGVPLVLVDTLGVGYGVTAILGIGAITTGFIGLRRLNRISTKKAVALPAPAQASVATESPRPGWRPRCEQAGSVDTFGRGVRLSVEGGIETASGLRCRVTGPTVTADSVRRLVGASGSRAEEQFHFPGEFMPKFEMASLATGEYRFAWYGDVGDGLDSDEQFLVDATFEVGEDNRVTCGMVGVSGWRGVIDWVPPEEGGSTGAWTRLKLYPPESHSLQHPERIRMPVTYEDGTEYRLGHGAPMMAQHRHKDEPPHYLAHFPEFYADMSKDSALPDGRYEVRWEQRHAKGWRAVDSPSWFLIRNGEVQEPPEGWASG